MDNSNSNSFSSPMFITERAQFSLYSQIMLSYLAVKECSDVVRDGFIPPSSDKANMQCSTEAQISRCKQGGRDSKIFALLPPAQAESGDSVS